MGIVTCMASGTLVSDELREKRRWGENNKVYRRKIHSKGLKKNNSIINKNNINVHQQSSQTLVTEDENSSQKQENCSRLDEVSNNDGNGVIKPLITRIDDRVRIDIVDGSSKSEIREIRRKLVSELDQVRSLVKKLEAKEVQLSGYSSGGGGVDDCNGHSQYSENNVMKTGGLMRVNSEVGSVDHHDSRPSHMLSVDDCNGHLQYLGNNVMNPGGLVRANSELGSLDHHDSRPFQKLSVHDGNGHSQYLDNNVMNRGGLVRTISELGSLDNHNSRPFQKLSVQVFANNHGISDFVEKEKRTPKANQYYCNSEFLLGKDRLPPESNKKLKSNVTKKHGRDFGYGFFMDKLKTRAFKSCSNLLTRLMKHKHGWLFNKPVDAKALGIHDYHDIIKHPMDLGTIKNRLAKKSYKSPEEFAEDVRLTFDNAMTYNLKGQDAYIMAEQLSQIFEENWAVIEAEMNLDWRYQMVNNMVLQTPTLNKVQLLDRSESMTGTTMNVDPNVNTLNSTKAVRTPVPKKPKANDLNKRDMTTEEKQKLSTNLQNLPSEKLDGVIQIFKKSNSALSQQDDEVEVDIDCMDAETLWELDRFVVNYKKGLSKHKRRAELALKARAEATHSIPAMNSSAGTGEPPKESRKDENHITNSAPVQGDTASRTSSSSSSSSDSDSSSSDSDSDSSSDESDGGH